MRLLHLHTQRDRVPVGVPGVYWLAYRQNGVVRYVGSTPNGGTLRKRLGQHASNRIYSWFWFEATSSHAEALWRECQEYAKHIRTIENRRRPAFCRARGHQH